MFTEGLDYGFLKVYAEAITMTPNYQPLIINQNENENETEPESVVNKGENEVEPECVNNVDDYVGSSEDEDYTSENDEYDDEDSLSSDVSDSDMDEEYVIAKQNLKDFCKTIVDNGFGLGLDRDQGRDDTGFVWASNNTRVDGNMSDSSVYHSEYPNSDAEVDTPVSSDEDDCGFREKKREKKNLQS
eukprot:XP_015580328.1 uncharacterized protein LOC107261990 [Ricinus communis]